MVVCRHTHHHSPLCSELGQIVVPLLVFGGMFVWAWSR